MSEALPEEELNQLDRNLAQVHIMRGMLRRKIIATYEEYAEKFAPIFEMLWEGELEFAEPDWDKIRSEVGMLIKGCSKS